MAPPARIPLELKLGPFTVGEAHRAGVSWTSLQGKSWQRLSNGLYCWSGLIDDPMGVLRAWQRLFPDSVFAGPTAAWLHGIGYVDPIHPLEVIMPTDAGVRSRRGLIVHRSGIAIEEVAIARALRATTIVRTLIDLCRTMAGADALVMLDAALHLNLTDKPSLAKAGNANLRALAALAEPAASPMETRLRWVLMKTTLDRPEVQRNLYDSQRRFVGRADLYYPDSRLVVEFDGGNHRDRLVDDNRRQNLLINAGYKVLRFTSSDIYTRPETIVAQVSAAAAVSARRPAAARR